MDRRNFLKICGSLSLVLVATPLRPLAFEKSSKPSYAMIIDLERCMGCESCVVACRLTNMNQVDGFRTRIEFVESGSFPEAHPYFIPLLCNQCKHAPCMEACKIGAIRYIPGGIVYTDWAICDGSGECVSACPFGMRSIDEDNGGKSFKCDFCIDRIEEGNPPLCVATCPSKARLFGDLSHPSGEFAAYLSKGYLFQVAAFKGLKGRVFYAGNREMAQLAMKGRKRQW